MAKRKGAEGDEGRLQHPTREGWLQAAVERITQVIFETESLKHVTIPQVHVSVGWPGGRGPKATTIGQCWNTDASSDKVNQIFISPVQENPVNVLATLTHELIHASDNGASKHRGYFAKTASVVGFKHPFTASQVNGKVNGDGPLITTLEHIAKELGPYPHSKLSVETRPAVQKTYMLKLGPSPDCYECDPEYKLRMTEKWLEDGGAPMCPHGFTMEVQ